MHAPDDRLDELERRLQGWTPAPAPAGQDRDRLLFQAGHASAREDSRRRAWTFATAAASLVAVGLGLAWSREADHRRGLERELLALRVDSTQRPVEPSPTPGPAFAVRPSPAGVVDPSSYLALARDLTRLTDPHRPSDIEGTDRPALPDTPDRPTLSPLRSLRGGPPIDL